MSPIPLSERQRKIAEIVRQEGPVAGEAIARELGLSRAALRSDLAILTMSGILDARPRVGYFYTGKNTLGLLQEELSSITVEDIKASPLWSAATKVPMMPPSPCSWKMWERYSWWKGRKGCSMGWFPGKTC